MKNSISTSSLKFLLEIDTEGWPPVRIENLVAKQICASEFEILVAPFFIKEISAGDIIEVQIDVDGFVISWVKKSNSTRSTIWVLCKDFSKINSTLEALKKHGCNVERLKQFNLIALDVPENLEGNFLEEYLLEMESEGASIACPSFRH